MIIITGDTHGDIARIYNIQNKYNLTDKDYIIVCGDFGFIWDKEFSLKLRKVRRITKAKILFVDGNHENFNMIENFPQEDKWGGVVHNVNDQVYHLMRGEVYEINGHTFFAFGGADSIDKEWRIAEISWWQQEIPTIEEIAHGAENLSTNINNIEYVLTHEAPNIIRNQLLTMHFGEENYKLPLYLDSWFERLYFDAPNFKQWYCGHHHQDREFSDKKFTALYYNTIVIND